jgi:sec-independent protein translocase protein TatA
MTISSLLLIGGLGTPELIIILIVVLLLFGGKKIPELMKAMGQGVKSFKDGVSGINDSIEKAGESAPSNQNTASNVAATNAADAAASNNAVSDTAADNTVKPADVDKH